MAVSLVLLVLSQTVALAQPLPTWVQNHRPATLWSGPDANAIAFVTLPPWSGFEVLGRQGGRLFVRYVGNGVDREPGVAWVDQGDVGPTDRPFLWVTPAQPAALWSGPDESATLFGFAPVDSQMVRLETSKNGRVHVFFLGAEPDHQPGPAWVALKELRPGGAPPADSPRWQVWGMWEAQVAAEARRLEAMRLAALNPPPLQAPAPRPSAAISPVFHPITPAEQQRFIEVVGQLARRYRAEIGLPPSLVTAIAINESGWGRSRLSREFHNYFGIKAHRGLGTAGSVEMLTWEVIDGQDVTIRAPFRAYHSMEESVRDLGAFLRANSRYNRLLAVGGHDPHIAARELAAAGYATDPLYAEKLLRLIAQHNLVRLDGP